MKCSAATSRGWHQEQTWFSLAEKYWGGGGGGAQIHQGPLTMALVCGSLIEGWEEPCGMTQKTVCL